MVLDCKIRSIEWKWIAGIDENIWEANKKDKNKNIEILMMRNGSGKTTTLELLQYLFSGINLDVNDESQKTLLTRARYKGLRTESNGELNKNDFGESEFAVTVEINGENWMLIYKFDEDGSSAIIHTRSPDGVYSTEYKMPNDFQIVFRDNLSLCKTLFIDAQEDDRKYQLMKKETLDDMVQRLSNTKILYFLREERIPRLLKNILENEGKTGSLKEREESQQQLKVVETLIEKLEGELKEKQISLDGKVISLDTANEVIRRLRKASKNAKQYRAKEKELGKNEELRKRAASNLLEALFNPGNLPNKIFTPIKNYYSNLAKERIPEAIAEEYLDAIIEREKCICGTPINSGGDLEKSILEERRRSMGMAILSDVYSMKAKVRNAENSDDLILLRKRLKNLNTRTDEIRTELENLGGKETGDALEKMKKATSDKVTLESEIRVLRKEINIISETDPAVIRENKKEWLGRSIKANGEPAQGRGAIRDDCKNIYWAKRIERVIKDKIASIAGIEGIQNAANCLTDLLEDVERNISENLRQKLLKETKENMAKYNLQGNLEIKDFSDGIVLERKEWGEDSVIQNSGSTGENLAILAGFTESVEAIMNVKIPLIIDNPTKGADKGKIAATCKSLNKIAKNSTMILFIYDTERWGLEEHLKDRYNHSTLYREHEWYENKINYEEAKVKKMIGRTQISYDKEMYFNYTSYIPPKMEGEK